MNVLALSHSCATDVNQQQFVAMNSLPRVNVELMIPDRWISEYTGEPFKPKLLPSVSFPVLRLPVVAAGNVSLHFYSALPKLSDLTNRPDVLLSTQEPWSLSGYQAARLARRFKIPYIFQTNQNILKRYPAPFSNIEQLHYRTASAGVAFSEEARNVLEKKGIQIPTYVVPYGTDTSVFHSGRSTALRQRLGVDNTLVVGYMGRLVPEKALDTFLMAAAKIKDDPDVPPFKLLFVGSGPDLDRLTALAASLSLTERTVFAGPVMHTEASDYLRCMDLFVLPSRTTASWKEQFGRVLIESMACGVPVLGSDSGAIPKVIEDTGGGLVFREDDVADCAAQLSKLLTDTQLRTSLGAQGARRVADRYSFEAVAKQLVTILEQECLKSIR